MRKSRWPNSAHGIISTESWHSHFSILLNWDRNDDHSLDPPADDGYAVHAELLVSEISEDEDRKAIRKLKSGKADGADQVINQFLKSVKRLILPFLVKRAMSFSRRATAQRSGPRP